MVMLIRTLTLRALTIMVAAVLVGFAAFAVSGDSGVSAQEGNNVGEAPSALSAVPVDGSWILFDFTGAGVPATGCFPCTFTAGAGGVNISVTDCCLNGDVFEVFDFGSSIGVTSAVAASGVCGVDPDVCFADPLASSGTFFVGPGDHSITITPTVSPFGDGSAWFRLDAKPDPTPTNTPTPTPTPTDTPTPVPPVGGIGVFPGSGDSGSSSVAVITGFAAIATAIALAGAAWYARRRWAR